MLSFQRDVVKLYLGIGKICTYAYTHNKTKCRRKVHRFPWGEFRKQEELEGEKGKGNDTKPVLMYEILK